MRTFTGGFLAALLIAIVPTFDASVASAACTKPYVPNDCTKMRPGDKLPAEIKDKCFVFDEGSTGTYSTEFINVLSGGAIYFSDPGKDPTTQKARTIDFRTSALVVEKGGVVQAGSPDCPFGKDGGRLAIGLYGDDPTNQGKNAKPTKPGIQCLTNKNADPLYRCFPEFDKDGTTKRNYASTKYYCNVANSDDPCSAKSPVSSEPKNEQLEGYGALSFDDNPWGYKTIGVSYGGTLAFYGWKGSKGLQDAQWASLYEADDHCPVPSVDKSTLNVAEMQEWANFSGTSWARLAGSVDDVANNKTTITLDRSVTKPDGTDWEVGDEIVIGATDWYPSHTEQRLINKVTTSGLGTQIEVDLLKWKHFDQIFNAKSLGTFTNPVNREAVDMRAIVGLLSRSITIYSRGNTSGDDFPKTTACTHDKNPNGDCYFGGHLVARQGFKQVALQGVEFKQMGQGGRMGHYPVHFHMAKSTKYAKGGAFIKDSSVWDSMTRFVTVHGTHDLTVSRNVGYLSLGHGFYIEDGSEIRNRLCHNAGLSARAALQQYVVEQAKPEHWCNGEPPPAARVVPPILDKTIDIGGGSFRIGSDTYMPTMYWMMNAYNEFVGNAAVSVHGFGSCYWLLGSAVSGLSRSAQFDGFAKYNTGGYQAPLLRFRGNTCMTAALALPTSKEIKPAAGNEAELTGFTALRNPYTSAPDYSKQVAFPIIDGNFKPIQPNGKTTNCSENNTDLIQLGYNTDACVMTVIDRFATSFNWAEINFGSVWLRPWFYLFSNGAVTDQLSGGLGFITGGSWIQALPAYLSLTQNSLFVGVTQNEFSPHSDRSGPLIIPKDGDSFGSYKPCNGPLTCNFWEEGTGYWKDAYQPKRMISIYDGPFYADGNTFLNIGSFECNPQPCANANNPAACKSLVASGPRKGSFPCGIYSSTIQPMSPLDKDKIIVANAAIGWKQPNGFYYPPAFTLRRSSFPQNRSDELNKCFTLAPGDFVKLTEQDGSCRHTVVDRYQTYLKGDMAGLNVQPLRYTPDSNTLPSTTIDFATILIDLDASLTGADGGLVGRLPEGPTASVSRNKFFDAPTQSPECLSLGVQTSPYTFVTTVLGKLKSPSTSTANVIDTSDTANFPPKAAVPIFRQWLTAEDKKTEQTEPCTSVCNGSKYGCARATFLGMSSVSQASYLTMTIPPGISQSSQPGAMYYIDTNSGTQSLSCLNQRGDFKPATFQEQTSYVLYNIFPQSDSKSSYQMYVGDNVALKDLQFRYVRVQTHEVRTVPLQAAQQVVNQPCDPDDLIAKGWCVGMPKPVVKNGVMTVVLDHKTIAGDFTIAARKSPIEGSPNADYERCMPRDMCYFDESAKLCKRCTKGNSKCIRQDDFLAIDVETMNRTDANGKKPLDSLCTDWASLASGNVKIGDKSSPLTTADCPAGGCLGVAFMLPKGFRPQPYQQINQRLNLSRCFVSTPWLGNSLTARANDKQCGAPRPPSEADFCTDPKVDLPPEDDAFISEQEPGANSGDSSDLVVSGEGEGGADAAGLQEGADVKEARSLIAFDQDAIDAYLAGRDLTRATLAVTLKDAAQGGLLVDAHPLLQDFVEGDPDDLPAEAFAAAYEANATGGLVPAGGLIPVGGKRRLPTLPGRGNPPGNPGGPIDGQDGVTWMCASDDDIANDVATDCAVPWQTPGGDYGPATAAPAEVDGAAGTVISWDVTDDVLNGVGSWLLRLHDESAAGGVVFYSEEGALQVGDPDLGPVLILE